jgi:hypothetical protein
MTDPNWITPKAAADLAGVSRKTFMLEWIPEEGEPQVHFRNRNGKSGHGRRPEIYRPDLENVLATRNHLRAG